MPAPYPTYHVGDRVIVRTWDDMMEEFGSNPYGDITVHPNKLSFMLHSSVISKSSNLLPPPPPGSQAPSAD